MRVHLGADHAAFEAKNDLAAWLEEQGHEVVDHGPHVYDADDDYHPGRNHHEPDGLTYPRWAGRTTITTPARIARRRLGGVLCGW